MERHETIALNMVDIAKQVSFWRIGAAEDWVVASDLVERGRARHGLFLAHLAIEKALKAHVCLEVQDLAPRIHNLVRLAELANLRLPPDHLETLAELNAFNIEGRYPDPTIALPDPREAKQFLGRAQEVFECLMRES
jgi:HEPN domain-containing protein